MKLVLALIIIAIAAHQLNATPVRAFQGKWEQHVGKYGLTFLNSDEEDKHYTNYVENLATIQAWNSDSSNTFKLGENKFSHLDVDTYRKTVLMPKTLHGAGAVGAGATTTKTTTKSTTTTKTTTKSTTTTKTTTKSTTTTAKTTTTTAKTTTTTAKSSYTTISNTLSSYVNWTSKFVGVKDQGMCGSCYAFAAAGALESAYAIKYGSTLSLSEEQIIDCTYTPNPSYGGCDGGNCDTSYSYVQSNSLYQTADYPYISAGDTDYGAPTGTCHSVTATKPRIGISSFVSAGTTENAVALFVQNYGPVTAYIDASQDSFQLYSSGIYNEPKCTQYTDHAVIIVGFGSDSSGNAYWIIRNSWGTSWGMKGYMLLARNKGGLCGIVTGNFFPLVK